MCLCVLWLRPSLSQPATSPSALCQLLSSQVHLTSLQLWSLAWSSWIQLQLVGGTPGASLQAKGSKCGSWQSWRPALRLPFPGTLPLQGSKKSISTSLLGTGARSKAWRGSQLAKPEPRRTHAFTRVPPQHLLVLAPDLYSSEICGTMRYAMYNTHVFVYTYAAYAAMLDTRRESISGAHPSTSQAAKKSISFCDLSWFQHQNTAISGLLQL